MSVVTFTDLEATLRGALAAPLPGIEAQYRLAPRPRPPDWRPGHYPEDARRAAGLLLLYPVQAEPHLVLTVRADTLPQHGGQVSFPGGALDADETIEQAALREASEEVGIEPGHTRIVGALTPVHISVSRFVLHPIVGLADRRPDLRPADREVARILEVPLGDLFDPARLRRGRWFRNGREYDVPFFDLGGARVWGATAMVLAEFAALLGHRPDPWAAGAPPDERSL